MEDYEILTLNDSSKWNDFFQKLPIEQRDIYYTPDYYRIYEENGDGKAKCFVYKKAKNLALYPFLQNSVNDLGYKLDKEYFDVQGVYGYNGIISNNNSEIFISGFYNEFNRYCKENNIIAEFTRFHPLLNNQVTSLNHVTVIKDRVVVVIDLTKEYSAIWDSEYSSRNRNMIRKANKLGYKIQVLKDPTDNDLDVFLDIYYYSMKIANAEKYYFFKREYFVNIFNYMSDHAFLLNVLNNTNEVVCSSIFFQYGDYFHYHLSGRNNKADNSVNNFLIDKAVDFAQKNRAKFFHLGGGRSTNDNDSLLKFKKSFSNKTLPFFIGKRIHNEGKYKSIVEQWEIKYPEKIEKYKNLALKYRFKI